MCRLNKNINEKNKEMTLCNLQNVNQNTKKLDPTALGLQEPSI